MTRLSTILQFVLGFILGIALLSGVAAGAAYFYLTSISEYPPKPTFPEESSPTAETEQETTSPPVETETEETATVDTTQETEEATEAEPESEPKPPEELPTGAYRARVTWPEGLSLRAEPSTNAERVGGIDFNDEIIILEESEDKQWQRVRIGQSDREGWVKAGNVERVNGSRSVGSEQMN